MPGSTGSRHVGNDGTWCSWPISAIRWPAAHVYMRERQHRLSFGSYGRPRMTEELNELGIRVGQRRVGRLMRQNGIQVIRSRKFKRTTDSDHAFNIAPNLLQQDFTASGPNQKWAGDITYVWTREGWVYLAVIIDLFSRRVVALRDLPANPFRVTDGPSATA